MHRVYLEGRRALRIATLAGYKYSFCFGSNTDGYFDCSDGQIAVDKLALAAKLVGERGWMGGFSRHGSKESSFTEEWFFDAK